MGIYLIEILNGYWFTKKVLTALKTGDSYPEGREGKDHKKLFKDNSV
jgi:hypothetical protein